MVEQVGLVDGETTKNAHVHVELAAARKVGGELENRLLKHLLFKVGLSNGLNLQVHMDLISLTRSNNVSAPIEVRFSRLKMGVSVEFPSIFLAIFG